MGRVHIDGKNRVHDEEELRLLVWSWRRYVGTLIRPTASLVHSFTQMRMRDMSLEASDAMQICMLVALCLQDVTLRVDRHEDLCDGLLAGGLRLVMMKRLC